MELATQLKINDIYNCEFDNGNQAIDVKSIFNALNDDDQLFLSGIQMITAMKTQDNSEPMHAEAVKI